MYIVSYMLLATATNAKPKTISGAMVTLLLAIAAAIPLLLRLYFRERWHKSRQSASIAKKRLKSQVQIEREKIALEKKKIQMEERVAKAAIKASSGDTGPDTKKIAATAVGTLLPGVGLAMAAKDAIEGSSGAAQPMTIEDKQAAPSYAEKMTENIRQMADVELFRQKALRLGCNESMSLGEMAQVVLKYAPAMSIAELPEGLSDEEKAVALLGAYKNQKEVKQLCVGN